MTKTNKNVKVVVDYDFLALPEIKQIRAKYKYLGFTVAVMLQLELSKYKHGIGRISALRPMSHEIGVQLKTLTGIMNECCMFVMDYKNDVFYIPRLRKKLHLTIQPSDEEINDILNNGNVYYGYGEKRDTESETYEKDSEKISERFEILQTQNADNQNKSDFTIKDKDIKVKDKDIISDDDDAGENKFKEILSSHSWCRSVKKRHGVNLEDAGTLGIFAQWMYNYCRTNDKKLNSRSELRRYASNLLRHGTNTRAEFDRYCTEAVPDQYMTMHCADNQRKDIHIADYENVCDGVRYTCEGQIIPHDAPKQPAPSMAYSYIRNEWISIREYDAVSETAAYDRNVSEIPGYVKGLGGAE